jgi:hypothetical protein
MFDSEIKILGGASILVCSSYFIGIFELHWSYVAACCGAMIALITLKYPQVSKGNIKRL